LGFYRLNCVSREPGKTADIFSARKLLFLPVNPVNIVKLPGSYLVF
jgi:hypothetical protein